jgi:predicted patatin/cPLA2 family phospholipase
MSDEISVDYDTLVLPGGGTKGFSILGGLQCAIDNGYLKDVKTYIGTSVGSMICYLLAIGYTPIEILVSVYTHRCLEHMQYFNLVAMINGNGATSFRNINEFLENCTISKIGRFLTLGKLKELYGKTLISVSYNMTTCVTEYIGPDNYPDLPCLTAIRMSSNIPLVFERFKYMDNYYIDGGFTDNFPILKGEEIGTRVFGLHLEIDENSLKDEPEDGLITYFIRLMQIPIIQSTKNKIKLATNKSLVITIKGGYMKNVIDFDIKSKVRLDMFSYGYQDVKKILHNSFSVSDNSYCPSHNPSA